MMENKVGENLFEWFKEKYRQEGYEKGVEVTTKKYEKLFDELEQIINEKLLNEQNNQQNIKQTNNQANINTIDEVIFWFNCYAEVLDTRLFKDMLFKDTNSDEIKIILNWLDYIEHTYEIKLTYPKTYFYLPNLKKAFNELYQNKLIIEEAERTGKS